MGDPARPALNRRGIETAPQPVARVANAPAHRLFERVSVRRVVDGESVDLRSPGARELPPARAYADYAVHVDTGDLPGGVDVVDRI